MSAPHPIPDAALESDIAILGKKGRGKSYTARGIAERLLAMGRRVVVLDPLSTWWGLAAGDAGFPIAVLGGPHGDLPLSAEHGEALGRYLAGARQSAVLDLGHMRKAEMIRFATPFLEELYTHNREPLWLVLEEADVFAPQNPGGDVARLYGEVDRIARRGRQFGFRLISLTQRPARLAKDVLTQLSTLIALGITSPQDRDAIKAWVEGNADRDQARAVVYSLASLKVGEGWVWAPDLDLLSRVTFPANRTPDTSATPKAGEARLDTSIRQTADVAAIRWALGTADIKSAAPSEASTKERRTADISPAALAAAEQRGYERGYETGARHAAAEARLLLSELRARLDHFEERLASPWFYRDESFGDRMPEVAPVAHIASPASAARLAPKPARAAPAVGNELNSAARKLLAVLDTNPPVRRSWTQVATLAGLRARGGHFNAGRKGLIDSGLVRVDGELVQIATPSAGAGPEAIDGHALVEMWAGSLSGAAPRILRYLAGTGTTSRAAVADALGLQPRGGHWNAAWKELRDNTLIEERGEIVRIGDLFNLNREARS